MKTHLAISGLCALITLHAVQAAQPNIRTQSKGRDSDRRSERSGGIRGFFRGIVGEIQEGGVVIGDGFRDVRDGIKSKGAREEAPQFATPRYATPPYAPPQDGSGGRFGYQSPPPATYDGVTYGDPGPPVRGEIVRTRFGIRTDGNGMPAAAPRQRTLPRQPAPAPPTRSPETTPTREPLPEVRRVTTSSPQVETPSAQIRTEPPAVKTVPKSPKPEIVAPKTKSVTLAPRNPAPTPKVEDTPPTPQSESKPAPDPKMEERPIAKDEKGQPLPDKPDYPTATATKDPGLVLSPYPPYDPLDVKGMAPGSLAKDPATGQVFRVP